MRLIDADALLAAFRDAKDYVIWDSDDDRNSGIDDCIRVLDSTPAITCERCRHEGVCDEMLTRLGEWFADIDACDHFEEVE